MAHSFRNASTSSGAISVNSDAITGLPQTGDEDETDDDESEGEAPADAFKAKRAMLVTGPPPLGAAYDDEDETDEDDEDDEEDEAPVAEAPAAAAAPGTYDDDEFDEA